MKIVHTTIGNNKKPLIGYLHDTITEVETSHKIRPAIVLCPGGGYRFHSEREADPVAMRYFAYGFQVFILYYSIGDEIATSTPLLELSEAVVYIKHHEGEFCVNKDQIAVMGFSAGAHVAASLATLWSDPLCASFHGENRPDCAILGYPVITMNEYCHEGSMERLTHRDPRLRDFYSLETRVSADTVPIFIWHTRTDEKVPIQNTLRFISSLEENKIPYEAHIYPYGLHGMSMANEEVGTADTHIASWVELSLSWLSLRWLFKA